MRTTKRTWAIGSLLVGCAAAFGSPINIEQSLRGVTAEASLVDARPGQPDERDETFLIEKTEALSSSFDASLTAAAATTTQYVRTTSILQSNITGTQISATASLEYEAFARRVDQNRAASGGGAFARIGFALSQPTEVEFQARVSRGLGTFLALQGPSIAVGLGEQGFGGGQGQPDGSQVLSVRRVLAPGSYEIYATTWLFGQYWGYPINQLPDGDSSSFRSWSFDLRVVPVPASTLLLAGLGLRAHRRREP